MSDIMPKVNTNVSLPVKKKSKNNYVWYIFLLPTFLGIALFMAYPIFESLRLSFYRSNGMIETFTGLDNFQKTILAYSLQINDEAQNLSLE